MWSKYAADHNSDLRAWGALVQSLGDVSCPVACLFSVHHHYWELEEPAILQNNALQHFHRHSLCSRAAGVQRELPVNNKLIHMVPPVPSRAQGLLWRVMEVHGGTGARLARHTSQHHKREVRAHALPGALQKQVPKGSELMSTARCRVSSCQLW